VSTGVLVRVGLVAAGLLCFGAGVRTGSEAIRWVGIACIGAALVARLVERLASRR
jgi:hypothetical protein